MRSGASEFATQDSALRHFLTNVSTIPLCGRSAAYDSSGTGTGDEDVPGHDRSCQRGISVNLTDLAPDRRKHDLARCNSPHIYKSPVSAGQSGSGADTVTLDSVENKIP